MTPPGSERLLPETPLAEKERLPRKSIEIPHELAAGLAEALAEDGRDIPKHLHGEAGNGVGEAVEGGAALVLLVPIQEET